MQGAFTHDYTVAVTLLIAPPLWGATVSHVGVRMGNKNRLPLIEFNVESGRQDFSSSDACVRDCEEERCWRRTVPLF